MHVVGIVWVKGEQKGNIKVYKKGMDKLAPDL